MLLFFDVVWFVERGGRVSPRRATHFSLQRPKKSKQKKGEPGVWAPSLRCGVPCAARIRREAQKLGPLALRHLSLLIRRLLRCSALPQRRGEEQPDIQTTGYEPALMGQLEDPHPNPLPKGRGGNSRNPAACGTRFSPPAVMRRRVAQIWADQGWRCLSEASLARPRPNRATQRARSAAQGRRIRLAFSLPTFFWRSKRQVGRPPGRDPASSPTWPPGHDLAPRAENERQSITKR